MNLLNIAMILEDIRIGDIKYGDYAVSRFNEAVKLNPPIHLGMTGEDIRDWLSCLDETVCQTVLTKRLLSTPETQEFIQYLDTYRQSDVRQEELSDLPYVTFGYITAFGSVLLVIGGTVMYISYADIHNDHQGIVWDGLGTVWDLAVKMVRKYFGV